MEGMFLINITPWSAHQNIGDYAKFLMSQHIYPHFRNGSTEVHLLFDDPECVQQSPKYFERMQRDKVTKCPEDHQCTDFSPDMIIPPKWRNDVLSCRKCKRNLVCFLSTYFLTKMQPKLREQQTFIVAGGFCDHLQNKALFVTAASGQPQGNESLYCNAEESDTRIWLHVIMSTGTKKLVLSPDTDVYHIGLPIIAGTELECLVRLSCFNSLEHRFLNVQSLLSAFNNDPSLAAVRQTSLPSVMQMLYMCTGCDFISFFNGFGKATFMATFFEYCDFICTHTTHTPGTADTDPDSDGFLSFTQLVGCAYFKKHKAVFLPSFPTPSTLFNSLNKNDQDPRSHHSDWLALIREKIWVRIKYEEEMIPSDDALHKHWKRACLVYNVWGQANSNTITYPPLEGNGWKQPDPTTLAIDWDSEQNIAQIRQRVSLMQKGCGCKTGCTTARCKCKRENHYCGLGCKCQSCVNLPAQPNSSADSLDYDSSSDSEQELDDDVDNIMEQIFGSRSNDSDFHDTPDEYKDN